MGFTQLTGMTKNQEFGVEDASPGFIYGILYLPTSSCDVRSAQLLSLMSLNAGVKKRVTAPIS